MLKHTSCHASQLDVGLQCSTELYHYNPLCSALLPLPLLNVSTNRVQECFTNYFVSVKWDACKASKLSEINPRREDIFSHLKPNHVCFHTFCLNLWRQLSCFLHPTPCSTASFSNMHLSQNKCIVLSMMILLLKQNCWALIHIYSLAVWWPEHSNQGALF